ncbi:tRNA (guanine(46)-N(7))-methyltransferase TrmB [Aliidiomarina celeris]|uniref:tRNA (guanine(46)-N(7))-methyltransferase TrmB n=1 Tax=Aliidiomarina celeris TaxID=2249428 RepID=UPI000DEB7640|nr:SAM-dependent methyltransferase [Aliidiomarina celeris]
MVQKLARSITTNQHGVHEDTAFYVRRYQHTDFKKPVADHSREAFDSVAELVSAWRGEVILDSCCGVGESTAVIAGRNPNALVIGVDKSAHRLQRNLQHKTKAEGQTYYLLRADLNDFWRLAAEANWVLAKHFLLYPNPYPKQKHLQRRWHASPVFPSVVALGGHLTMRSNWFIYLQEMAVALRCYQRAASVAELAENEMPITPFERKYKEAGQALFELQADLTVEAN